MEDLFSTSLTIDNKNVNYHVRFENDRYNFISDQSDAAYKNFSIKREHDEWHEVEQLPDEIKTEAIRSLENYLLKQH